MKRSIAQFLLATVLLTFSTFAGLSIFGLHGLSMTMDTNHCVGLDCHSMLGQASANINCLDHCLSAATPATTIISPVATTLILLFVVIVLLASTGSFASSTAWSPPNRWRHGIGKILLQRHLAPVILRD